ncbi:MAG: hypothetical protein CIT01_04100 [Methanobacterium sp. BRmetb2]|jgi:hypothetical protein|nr:MAG: hypothetical protein CIT01_04100 [Methanobacterium sp. BRmetb2]
MIHINLDQPLLYDGSQIEPLWAFKIHKIKESSIVTWTGPMNIETSKVLDYEDVGLEIKANEMIHFIIEHFDCQPPDMRMAYHRQRIMVMIVKEVLAEHNIFCQREGDDLYVDGNKLTVSIATCSKSSIKIHFGINMVSEGTPDDVKTIGIIECDDNLKREDVEKIVTKICTKYISEISAIDKDIAKTRVF